MNKYEIERELRNKFNELNGQVVVHLATYRHNKAVNDAQRKKMQSAKDPSSRITAGLPGLTAFANQLKASAQIQNCWNEQERLFQQLLQMGAIPEVRYVR